MLQSKWIVAQSTRSCLQQLQQCEQRRELANMPTLSESSTHICRPS